jgi:hypothetical protein
MQNYRPIEILDIGVDKKTKFPVPIIYPDSFVETPIVDNFNVLDDYYNIQKTKSAPVYNGDSDLAQQVITDTNINN